MSISPAARWIIGAVLLILSYLALPLGAWMIAVSIGFGVSLVVLGLVKINTWIETRL